MVNLTHKEIKSKIDVNLTPQEKFRKYIELNGEKLITKTVTKLLKTYYEIECKNGHTYKVRGDIKLYNGSGCRECNNSKQRHSYEYVKKFIEKKNITLISKQYKNMKSRLKVECNVCNYYWEPRGDSIIGNNSGCPSCAGNIRGFGKEKILKAIEQKGGKLLSKYYNSNTKILIECKEGHKFEKVPYQLTGQNPTWCKYCYVHINEEIVRSIFIYIFDKDFEKTRRIIKNPETGYGLELDGYNSELKIAFERHGRQHYYKNHIYHTDYGIKRDKIKIDLCKKNGIKLIEIPYFVKPKELQKYIYSQLKKQNISYPEKKIIPIHDLQINLKSRYKELEKYARLKNVKVLTKSYIGSDNKYKFECEKGHIFHTTFGIMKDKRTKGNKCSECARNKKFSYEQIYNKVKERGFELISKNYENASTRLTVKCKNNHITHRTFRDIYYKKQKYGCRECYNESR